MSPDYIIAVRVDLGRRAGYHAAVDGTNRLIPNLLKSYGLDFKLEEYRLIQAWPDIVGPPIAAHTLPAEVRAKTLWVVVDSSPWLHQLTLLKPVLIEKLARYGGRSVIHDVRFRIGEVPLAKRPQRTEAPPPALSPADAALLENVLAPLTDPDLKASARRLFARTLPHNA
jgi:hypothetical protein